MSAPGFTPISLYYSTTAAATPSAGNLANGELAINITDGKLFYKDNGGVVKLLASNAGSAGDVVGPGSSTDNALVRFDTTTGKLVQNSVGILDDSGNLTGIAALTISGALTLNGGTANGVAYLNGSKVLTTGSALTFDGSTFQANTTGFRIGQSPADSPSSNIYASLIANTGETSEFWIGANTASVVGGSYLGGLGFYNTDNTTPGANLSGIKAYIKDSTGSMYLNFYAGNTYFGANTPQYTIDPAYHAWSAGTTEGMRLTSTGLGIGTSSPAAKLDVYANANSQNTILLRNADTSTANYGTQSYYRLDIAGSQIGGLKTTAKPLGGLSTPALYLTTAGAYPIAFGLNDSATPSMVLDTSGNLGLGVTPSAWGSNFAALQLKGLYGGALSTSSSSNTSTNLSHSAYHNGTNWIYGATGFGAARYEIDGPSGGATHKWYTAPSGTAGNAISFSQAMTLSAAGYLGIGTTNPPYGLTVSDAGGVGLEVGPGSQYSSGKLLLQAYNRSGSAYAQMDCAASLFTWIVSGSERARIDSSGNLLRGQTSSGNTNSRGFYSDTAGYFGQNHLNGDASGSVYAYFGYNGSTIGTITQNGTTAVSYNTSSDYRLKNITGPITNSGAYIDSLNPVEGTWKADGSTFVGLIAHEAQEVSRTPVATGTKDGEQMQGMDYSSPEIIANLIAEVKSLRARLAAANI
jgi:hypothetical protein